MKKTPYGRQPIACFLKDLSKPLPTLPGGGCADALVGASAAALLQFVAHLSLKRPNNSELKEEIRAILSRLECIQNGCLQIMDEDAEAYSRVVQALRLPNATNSQKAEKETAFQQTMKEALGPLLELIQGGVEMLGYGYFLVRRGYHATLADAATGSEMAHACIRSAVWMAEANLRRISDFDFVSQRRKILKEHLKEAEELYKNINDNMQHHGTTPF